MKKLVAPFLIAAAAVLWAANTVYAQAADVLRLEQVMSPQELSAAGLDKLTPAERVALEQWLERYTVVVARVAQRSPAQGAQGAESAGTASSRMPVRAVPSNPSFPDAPGSAPLPRRVAPNSGRVVEESAGGDIYLHGDDAMPRDYAITSNIEGGSFIALGNGTMWEVYLPDVPKTVSWRIGTDLVVRRASTAQNVGQDVYDYILINGATGSMAHAKYRGRVATKANTQ